MRRREFIAVLGDHGPFTSRCTESSGRGVRTGCRELYLFNRTSRWGETYET
jgi:hypothetical protein